MVLSTFLLSLPSPSQAMHFEVEGSSVLMSGSALKSDCTTREEILAQDKKIGTVVWLGGVERRQEGPNSRVGLHGNYNTNGGLLAEAPGKLRAWIVEHAPAVDKELMERWIHLPTNKSMMYFYNDKAELCENRSCTRLEGRSARNAGLSTP